MWSLVSAAHGRSRSRELKVALRQLEQFFLEEDIHPGNSAL
jgi:hypothetical protein